MAAVRGGRLVLDVSSLARWSGPAVGIARVEHALVTAALRRPGAVLVFYDAASRSLRRLRPEWQDIVTGWNGFVELPDEMPPRRGWRAFLPSRKPLVARLERWRLTASRPLAWLADVTQRAILAARLHETPLHDGAGRRIARVPLDLALGEALALGPDDMFFAAGSGWSHLDPVALGELKRAGGFRIAVLCYDLIPITHPQFWQAGITATVTEYWRGMLAIADLAVVNAQCIAADLRNFAGVAVPEIAVLPLGADPPEPVVTATLPVGLEPGRYALFVSTIEPRKGHAMLLAAWRGLLARGIPQRHGFRLVFVGRVGWMVERVMRDLADPALAGSVVHLRGVTDAMLGGLYAGAAFAVYPSAYEGFGLPVIEAFWRGKAVLASAGGALAETVGELSPVLAPDDATAWEAAMGLWIEEPAFRAPWEAKIRAGFRPLPWGEAADAILETVVGFGSGGHGP